MQRTCAMNDSGRFYGPKGWWHWKLWGGTRPSLCSQGILGIGEGKWQVDNLEVWLLLLSFEDLGQGKLTGSGVQSIGPRSMGWENFQIYGQREAVPQGVGELTILREVGGGTEVGTRATIIHTAYVSSTALRLCKNR